MTKAKVFRLIAVLMVLLALAGCAAQTAIEPEPVEEVSVNDATGVIVLADIDADDPINKIEELQPIIDYLAINLGDYGIGVGEVKIAPDLDTVIQWLATGEVDLLYDSPYPAAIANAEAGAQPIARGWRGGEPVYHSVFFTRADSGIETLDDLAGQTVAYDDPASTSGFLLPTAFLIENGFTATEVRSPSSSVSDDEVGYVFSGDDANTIEWVLSGRVGAGIVDNLTYMDSIPEETRTNLLVVAETEDIPRRFIMARGDLDPELVAAIQQLLVNMENDPQAEELLATLKTKRFDLFEDPQATLDQMQELLALVENQ